MKICKQCGHSQDNHNDEKCDEMTFLGIKCRCVNCDEIEINNNSDLAKEFDNAYKEDKDFLESSKKDGVYVISDFETAVRLHERQVALWKKLIAQ